MKHKKINNETSVNRRHKQYNNTMKNNYEVGVIGCMYIGSTVLIQGGFRAVLKIFSLFKKIKYVGRQLIL